MAEKSWGKKKKKMFIQFKAVLILLSHLHKTLMCSIINMHPSTTETLGDGAGS